MNNPSSTRSLPGRLRRLHLAALVVALLFVASCKTDQTQDILKRTDAVLYAPGADPAALADISKAIDDYAAKNPQDTATISPLRIRQAVLFVRTGQFEKAQAAFDAATDLHTPRDLALKALSPAIIWWWQHSQTPFLSSTQMSEAETHLAAFDQQIARLGEDADIRDFLAETRARMSLKYIASIHEDPARVRRSFVDLVNRYGATFTPDDVAAIKAKQVQPASAAVTTVERRRSRAMPLIPEIRKVAERVKRNGPVKPGDFDSNASVEAFAALILSPP
jgi:hypothetical protein